MLIFRDSILGFVSGIQLSANDMLKVGDWISVPKYLSLIHIYAFLTRRPSIVSYDLSQGDSLFMRADSMFLFTINENTERCV